MKKNSKAIEILGVQKRKDYTGTVGFRAVNKPMNLAPGIIREYFTEEVDQDTGESTFIRMYECESLPGRKKPRHFIAELYDAKFRPNHGLRLLPRKAPSKREKDKAKK